jgi:uncharacterized membrane protein required for colicin V production
MADVAFAFVLFVGLVSGLRRGFAKPAIGIIALVAATYVAVNVYPYAGPFTAQTLRLPAQVGFLVGGVGSFILVYFLAALIGRLVWKGLRGQTALQQADGAAEGAADMIAGQTKPGPVTMMLKPLPTRSGVLYWADKVLGAVLGVAQSALVVLVVLFAASSLPLGATGEKIRESSAYREYKAVVEPEIHDLDAVRFVKSVKDIAAIADDCEEKPGLFAKLAESKELEPVRDYAKIRELANDPALQEALKSKRYAEALKNEKLLATLTDRELLRRLVAVDWAAVRARLASEAAAGSKSSDDEGKKKEEKPAAEGGSTSASSGGDEPEKGLLPALPGKEEAR